jgi:hypothetical protein
MWRSDQDNGLSPRAPSATYLLIASITYCRLKYKRTNSFSGRMWFIFNLEKYSNASDNFIWVIVSLFRIVESVNSLDKIKSIYLSDSSTRH